MAVMRPGYEMICSESPDGQVLYALINGDLGWLMYLRSCEDAGFSSRNPGYDGPPGAEIDYYLDNGQCDSYPAGWALPVEEVRRAVSYFERERRPPPFVSWHNESDDGVALGDDPAEA